MHKEVATYLCLCAYLLQTLKTAYLIKTPESLLPTDSKLTITTSNRVTKFIWTSKHVLKPFMGPMIILLDDTITSNYLSYNIYISCNKEPYTWEQISKESNFIPELSHIHLIIIILIREKIQSNM